MKKRLLAVLTGIGLVLGWAAAMGEARQSPPGKVAGPETVSLTTADGVPWMRFTLGEARQYERGQAERPAAPQGLEEMYQWMEEGGEGAADIRVLRMPAGRVLASVSLTETGVSLSPGELTALWPRIAKNLGKKAIYVDDGAECADTALLDGREWLHVQTTAVLEGEEKMLSVSLEGFANCDDGWLVEIWTIQPGQAAYLYDEEASRELQADQQAAGEWLAGVSAPAIR